MNAGVYFVLGCLLTIIQVSHQAADPRLVKCSKKVVEQIHHFNWKQPPKCLDTNKLQNVFKSVDVFRGFYNSLPPKCRGKVIAKNGKVCVVILTQKFKRHNNAMKASIMSAVNNLFGATQGCILEAGRKFNNLDRYVLNGCP